MPSYLYRYEADGDFSGLIGASIEGGDGAMRGGLSTTGSVIMGTGELTIG